MSESSASSSAEARAGRLADHLGAFLETLTDLGYAEQTRRSKRAFVKALIRWVEHKRTKVPDLNEACLVHVPGAARRRPHKRRDRERAALQQFLQHLRSIGVAPPCPDPDLSPADVLVERYVDHLRRGPVRARPRLGTNPPTRSWPFWRAYEYADSRARRTRDSMGFRWLSGAPRPRRGIVRDAAFLGVVRRPTGVVMNVKYDSPCFLNRSAMVWASVRGRGYRLLQHLRLGFLQGSPEGQRLHLLSAVDHAEELLDRLENPCAVVLRHLVR